MADVVAEFDINMLRHPYYMQRWPQWLKWRYVYEGGYDFIHQYLEKFSKSEDDDDFAARKKISYAPSFAKAAVNEVKNSIYQRMVDITRVGGSPTYQDSVVGKDGGVDLRGSTMNVFIGMEVLAELLSMGRVGIYVDMPPKMGVTIAENRNIRPYLYVYRTEDIRSWDYYNTNQFRSVLLRSYIYTHDDVTGLPVGEIEIYRFYYIRDGVVYCRFYNNDSEIIDIQGNPSTIENDIPLNLTRIPFVMLELDESLLIDIADIQIALLNLASADMAYAIGANFPFYTEQFDPRYSSPHLKRPDTDGVPTSSEDLDLGPSSGRRYPIGTERPAFIFPSSEPMRASMDKQEQLKLEIRLLINLSIANIRPKMASAESKGMDERTLESGLSYIGLILEDAERRVAEIWAEYENPRNPINIASVNYPEQYDLRSDADRRREAKELRELLSDIPSDLYKRELAKLIAKIMLGSRVSIETLRKIFKEIDNAEVIDVDPKQLLDDVDKGLVDPKTASEARGYPEGSVDKAQTYQSERLALIQKAQTPLNGQGQGDGQPINPAARGNPDAAVNPTDAAKLEKVGKPGRGLGKSNPGN